MKSNMGRKKERLKKKKKRKRKEGRRRQLEEKMDVKQVKRFRRTFGKKEKERLWRVGIGRNRECR